jgi:HEAT repeat protein
MVCRKLLSYLGAVALLVCAASLQAAEADIAKLVEQLSSKEAQSRQNAAVALGQSANKSDVVVTALVNAVGDADPTVRRAAIEALRVLKPDPEKSIPQMVKVLESASSEVAISIVGVMAEAGEKAVPRINAALEHPNARYWAALIVEEIGPKAKEAVPAIVKALADAKEPDVRRELVLALGAIGPDAKAAVPTLVELVSDKDPAIVIAATYSLGQLGTAATSATDVLKKGTAAKDDFLRLVSAWALAAVNPKDKDIQKTVVPLLVSGLVDSDERGVRHAAAQAIVQLQLSSETMLPAVLAACEKSSPEVLVESVQALASVGRDAVPGLSKLLKHEKIRPVVAHVLGKLGNKASGAVPVMIEILPGSNDEAQNEILMALGNMGEGASPAVPAIAAALEDEEEDVRYAAIYALGQIGPPARDARRAIVKAMASEDPVFQTLCAVALVKIDPQGSDNAKEVLPFLEKSLEHTQPMVRIEGAYALGVLKRLAKPALPALKKMAEDKDPSISGAAKDAIKEIE